MNDTQVAMLEDLMALTGISTRKELFNAALTMLNWAANKAKNGNVIASLDEDTCLYREFSTPALDYAKELQDDKDRKA